MKILTAILLATFSFAAFGMPKLQWSTYVGKNLFQENVYEGKITAVIFSDEKFYNGSDWVYGFDHNGNILWKFKDSLDGKDSSLQFKPITESENGNIYVMGDSNIIALNDQGSLLWHYDFLHNLQQESSYCGLTVDNDRVLTNCNDSYGATPDRKIFSRRLVHHPIRKPLKQNGALGKDRVTLFDAKGHLVWQQTSTSSIVRTAFYAKQSILILNSDGDLKLLSNLGKTEKVWHNVDDFKLDKDILFTLSNNMTILTATNKSNQELWHAEVPNFFGEPYLSEIKIINDHIIVVNYSEKYTQLGIVAATILDKNGNLLRYKKITDDPSPYAGIMDNGHIYYGHFSQGSDSNDFLINIIDDNFNNVFETEFSPVNGWQAAINHLGHLQTLDDNGYFSQYTTQDGI